MRGRHCEKGCEECGEGIMDVAVRRRQCGEGYEEKCGEGIIGVAVEGKFKPEVAFSGVLYWISINP